MTIKFRAISAKYTPMPSNGGWLVIDSADHYQFVTSEEMSSLTSALDAALVHNVDYTIVFHAMSTSKRRYLKRVVFHTDEAFILGKMCL
jgi:hypothetical protein